MKRGANRQDSRVRRERDQRELTPRDAARLLRKLARVYREPATGNIATSDALDLIAEFLESCSQSDLRHSLSVENKAKDHDSSVSDALRNRYGDLPLKDVRLLLEDESVKKDHLIELAKGRFGIPSARLSRMSRRSVIDEILTSVRHEESLSIISKQARRRDWDNGDGDGDNEGER